MGLKTLNSYYEGLTETSRTSEISARTGLTVRLPSPYWPLCPGSSHSGIG